MKVLSILTLSTVLLVGGFTAGKAVGHVTVKYQPCDQQDYDAIYKSIIVEALDDYDHEPWAAIRIKNETIYKLRHLCGGQRSLFETDEPLYAVGAP